MYFNAKNKDEKEEFKLFIDKEIGNRLNIKTRKMTETFRKDIILKENLTKYIEIMNEFQIDYQVLTEDKTYEKLSFTQGKMIDEKINSEETAIRYLEQYQDNDIETSIKFDAIRNEVEYLLMDSTSFNPQLSKDLYRTEKTKVSKRYCYFVIDKQHTNQTKDILKHFFNIDIEFNYTNSKNEKLYIDGLAYFKITNDIFYARSHPLSYAILVKLLDSGINHCIYHDRDGELTFDIRLGGNPNDTRNSAVGFRKDIKTILKSSWEANIARILNYHEIKWEYEKDSFLVESEYLTTYYFPDFFLENNTLIEVKGFWDHNSIKKVELFKEQYKDYKLLTLDAEMYYTLDKLYSNIIPHWEEVPVTISKQRVPIVGITFGQRRKFVNQIKEGEEVFLKRDPNNPYDKNAISVLDKNNNDIGFIGKDWASIYAIKMDLGMKYSAIIIEKEPKVIHIDLKRTNLEEDILFEFLYPKEIK